MSKEIASSRISVEKTYKLYIGGKFPRTESGRYEKVKLTSGRTINACRASRKDFRNAVVACRKAQAGWQGRSAYNRGQIIYRLAEVLEGRRAQFEEALQLSGRKQDAIQEVDEAIDLLVYFAGWADKYQQISSSVNPVSQPFFNFSIPEPMGVVAVATPEDTGLLSLLECLLPSLTGGNSAVVLTPTNCAPTAIAWAEVVHTSDVPSGVINILTGHMNELYTHFASHMDVDALCISSASQSQLVEITDLAANNMKRICDRRKKYHGCLRSLGHYSILDTQEIKTTWHPAIV